MTNITCIILNYNNWELTQQCLSSITINPAAINLSIIIIDNQSTTHPKHLTYNNQQYTLFDYFNNTNKITPESHPNQQIISIQNSANDGFSSGVNIGIKFAQTYLNPDYYWLLNNDTICTENCLESLIKNANQNTIIGSTLIDQHGKESRSMGWINKYLATTTSNKKIPYVHIYPSHPV